MALRLEKIDFCSRLGSIFDEMVFGSSGEGVAVIHEKDLSYDGVSISRDKQEGVCVIMRGNPLREVERYRLSQSETDSRLGLLSNHFKQEGYISPPDILDGESFFIEWRSDASVVRLILGNPMELQDESLTEFARRICTFLVIGKEKHEK